MATDLQERAREHFVAVVELKRQRRELETQELELIREARSSNGGLVTVARASLAAQGRRTDPASLQREQARLRKRIERLNKNLNEGSVTTRHAKSTGAPRRTMSDESMLSDMNSTPSSTPRYRRQIVTETIEHFVESPDGLDGFEGDLDEHDIDDEEDS